MRIAILGAGALGSALAPRLAASGHAVALSFHRDPQALAALAGDLGVSHGAPNAVVRDAEVIVLAVPWNAVPEALDAAGDLAGKILWDCTNPLLADFSGLSIGTTTSAGEEVARMAPRARVIKGIPPMAALLASATPTIAGRAPAVFVAGNDDEAKRVVTELLAALPCEVTNAGDLTAARVIEPAMLLLVRLAYGLGHGPRVTLRFEHEP